jgi:hypothetical protein
MTNNKQQTEMNKEFIPYELALKVKQLGFEEPCFAWYGNGKLHSDIDLSMTDSLYCQKDMEPSNECTAPTYSQAFRFFREKYKLKCCIIPLVCEQGFSDLYESRIHQEKHSISRIGNYKTYEEAELACLKKLIEIANDKQ